MLCAKTIGMIATIGALMLPLAGARAFDDATYPDLHGQWKRAIAEGRASTRASRQAAGRGRR